MNAARGVSIRSMTVVLASAATLTLIAAWIRRKSILWRCNWEMAPTANVIGLTICMTLIPPHMDRFWSPILHRIFGVWNMDNLIGHTAYLVGITALMHNVVNRLTLRDRRGRIIDKRKYIAARITLPATVFLPLHTGLFLIAASDHEIPDMIAAAASTPWLAAYWLVFCAGTLWILEHLIWALLTIRTDPRSRRVSDLYLIAIAADCCCCASLALSAIVPTWPCELGWGAMAFATVGYAVAASYSWRQKTKPLDLRPFEMLN